jgi:DNA-binding MarR family transcriptional regulator
MQFICTDELSNDHRPRMSRRPAPEAERAYALASGLRAVTGKLRRRLRVDGSRGDLTSSQVAVILRLEGEGSATVSSLARAEAMRPQSMAALVASLEAAGLVVGMPDPDDGRQTLLSLSKPCRKRIRKGRAARQDWLTGRIRERLSAREQETLAQALGLLARLVED